MSITRYLDDYVPGTTYDLASFRVTEADIVEFAARYDPQPMHVDAAAAANGRFGGLVASGWHTASLAMRQYVDHFLGPDAGLASPGVDELRWPHPVRPGDLVRVSMTVTEVRPSRTRADRGVVRGTLEAVNQQGQPVLTVTMISIVAKRPVAH